MVELGPYWRLRLAVARSWLTRTHDAHGEFDPAVGMRSGAAGASAQLRYVVVIPNRDHVPDWASHQLR